MRDSTNLPQGRITVAQLIEIPACFGGVTPGNMHAEAATRTSRLRGAIVVSVMVSRCLHLPLLHLIEHLAERIANSQCLLDLLDRNTRITLELVEAFHPVVRQKLPESLWVSAWPPGRRESLQIRKEPLNPGFGKDPGRVVKYLSMSVSNEA